MDYCTDDTSCLYYDAAAADWNAALPLGNGRLGAMVYGDMRREHIALNLDELWTGYPREPEARNVEAALSAARRALDDGDSFRATKIIEEHCARFNMEAYMPLGHLYIDFPEAEITGYSRTLDLTEAVHRVNCKRDGNPVTATAFASFPDRVIVYRITAGKQGSLSFTVSFASDMKHEITVDGNTLILDGECIANSPANRAMFPERDFLYSDDPAKRGILYRGAMRVVTDGEVSPENGALSVKNATDAILYFTAESSFNGFDKHPYLEGKAYKPAVSAILAAAEKESYAALFKRHTDDYTALYSRVALDIGSDGKKDVPTDRRLREFAAGQGSADRGLITLFFNYGRYLAISASRPGSQPMNLQGIWNDSLTPPWHSNYTTNINLEMNYWPILMCDLPELNLPLVKMIGELAVNGSRTAETMYGADGFVVHHNSDLWRKTFPTTMDACWMFWPMSSGWLCRHLFDHYLYTADKEFLRNTAYPLMKSAATFYLCMLTEDKDGYLVMSPSTSPENIFIENGNICAVAVTSAMTMSIIRELFSECLKAADITGMEDDAFLKRIRSALPRLLPLRIGKKGDIIEWYKDEEWYDPHHRHVSHLYALHPAHEITPEKTPALIEAAKKTLYYRGDEGTGWSISWKINFFARLRDGDHALRLIKRQLNPVRAGDTAGGTYPNLFDAHPPFQIDGNFGVVSGIIEMLVQTDGENTYLLPALPSEWQNGSLRGVRLIGGAKLDMTWENGALASCTVTGRPFGQLIYKGSVLPVPDNGVVL